MFEFKTIDLITKIVHLADFIMSTGPIKRGDFLFFSSGQRSSQACHQCNVSPLQGALAIGRDFIIAVADRCPGSCWIDTGADPPERRECGFAS